MKVPIRQDRRKTITALAFATSWAARSARIGIALLGVAPLGCAARIAEAPFPARPDTVAPGSLRGPFEGQVLDAQSGKPVEGAAVLGAWGFTSGPSLVGPAGADWRLVETDADGRYRIPKLRISPDGSAALSRFTLVVYKRGYVAYRSDRQWEDLAPRHDFSQAANQARLDRPAADFTHARHLRFIGVGGPLLERLSWERQQASLETPAPAGKTAEPAVPTDGAVAGGDLDARLLLTADELKAISGWSGEFAVGRLGDLPSSPAYDSLHFRAETEGERFDAALRVFRLPSAKAEEQYEVMLKELPEATEKNEVASRSLRAKQGEVLALAFLDRPRGLVVLFTCGLGQCKDHEVLRKVASQLWARVGRLGQRSPAEEKSP